MSTTRATPHGEAQSKIGVTQFEVPAAALARIGAEEAPAVRARLQERLRIESSARVRRQLEDVLAR